MSTNKPQESFAIIKGAGDWRRYSIFNQDPTVSGVPVNHQNNAHNFNAVIPAQYPSRYPAKRACNSLNEKYPDGYYAVCKVIES